MKKLMILVMLMSVTSCGKFNRIVQNITGEAQEVCYKGVTYLQFGSGATVGYNKDNTVMLCAD